MRVRTVTTILIRTVWAVVATLLVMSPLARRRQPTTGVTYTGAPAARNMQK